jgi:hypothetical protein
MKPFKVVAPFEPAGVPHVARATPSNPFPAVLRPEPKVQRRQK